MRYAPAVSRLALATFLVGNGPLVAQDVWETVEVAQGVYASVVSDPAIYSQFSNSLIVVGEEGVLIVDPRESAAAGRALIEEVRALTSKPVRWVVNTHWHWDHVGGNQAFVEAYPGVEILAHPETGRLIETEGAERFDAEVQRLADRRTRLQAIAERGATDSGRALTEEDRSMIAEVLAMDETRGTALEQTELEGPTSTISSPRTLDLGRDVVVFAPAPGHTPGDLAVWVPDVGILFAGDLVEHGFPYVGDGNAFVMTRSLDDLAEVNPRTVLPAHGPVPGDRRLFEGQREFWRQVHALVVAAPEGTPVTAEVLRDAATGWPGAIDQLVEGLTAEAMPGGFDEEGRPTDRLRGWVEDSLLQAWERRGTH